MARLGQMTKLAIVALGVAALGTTVAAQDKAVLVKDRQAFMKALGADNKAISDYAKGAGSKEAAEKAIADMQAKNAKMSALFVAGTSSTDLPGVSYAKANIWSEKAKFDGLIATLKDAEAAEAATIKSGTPDAVSTGLVTIGRTGCGACHVAYREKLPG